MDGAPRGGYPGRPRARAAGLAVGLVLAAFGSGCDELADTGDTGQRTTEGAHDSSAPMQRSEAPSRPKTVVVSRVVDGDTVVLGNGQTVRLLGIDTPEVGQCYHEAAKANMERLVLGKKVTLGRSDADRDRYGRLLRYVDVGTVDAGLRQITSGLAIARYDSRDGYGYHPREPRYIAADRASRDPSCRGIQPLLPQRAARPGASCAPGYRPCVPPFPPDLDCDALNGAVYVTGSDPHGLDADGNGVACE